MGKMLCCFFVLLCSFCIAQQIPTNSLEAALKQPPAEDAARVTLLNLLPYNYYGTDPIKGLGMANEALALAASLNNKLTEGGSYLPVGKYYCITAAYEKALTIFQQLNNHSLIAKATMSIGMDYTFFPDYTGAIDFLQKGSGICEQLHNTAGMAKKNRQEHVSVKIEKVNNMPACTVEDDGPGIERNSHETLSKSFCMAITNARIAVINRLKKANAPVSVVDTAAGVKVLPV